MPTWQKKVDFPDENFWTISFTLL